MKPNICILWIVAVALMFSTAMKVAAQNPVPHQSVADFMMTQDRILHGYGMDMFRWHTDAVPYIAASARKPVLYGSYIVLTDIRARDQNRLEQLGRLGKGWTDPDTGVQYPILPLMGFHAFHYDFQDRRDSLGAEYFRVLGISQDIMDAIGIEKASYDLSIFSKLRDNPTLWQSVRDTLEHKGLFTADIDLDALLMDGSDEAEFRIIALRDSALVLAADRMIAQGVSFSDLVVRDGLLDAEIEELADSLKATEKPYIVRYMYETIGGVSRTVIYSKETFIEAHRRVVDIFRSRGATNVEFVYHANAGNLLNLESWYPGDDYIDWVSPSIYHSLISGAELKKARDHHTFAVRHDKPVFIAESGPTDAMYRPNNIDYPGVWEDWFEPYVNFLKDSPNVKAFMYIGIDHSILTGDFQDWGNTRVIENPELFDKWQNELANPVYMHNVEFWNTWNSLATHVDGDENGPFPDSQAEVWPNPFSHSMTVKFPGLSIEPIVVDVYDLLGRRIHSSRLPAHTTSYTWDGMSNTGHRVAPGTYIVRSRSDAGVWAVPVIRY